MYSVNLKKDIDGLLREVAMKTGSESTPRNSAVPVFYKIDKAQRLQYSTFDVGRSMFNAFSPSGGFTSPDKDNLIQSFIRQLSNGRRVS
jgi:hypothetical protein